MRGEGSGANWRVKGVFNSVEKKTKELLPIGQGDISKSQYLLKPCGHLV